MTEVLIHLESISDIARMQVAGSIEGIFGIKLG